MRLLIVLIVIVALLACVPGAGAQELALNETNASLEVSVSEPWNQSETWYRGIDEGSVAWSWLEDVNETESPYNAYNSSLELQVMHNISTVENTDTGWNFTDPNATAEIDLSNENIQSNVSFLFEVTASSWTEFGNITLNASLIPLDLHIRNDSGVKNFYGGNQMIGEFQANHSHQVSFVVSPGEAKFYLDGDLQDSSSGLDQVYSGVHIANSEATVSEVQVWNRALDNDSILKRWQGYRLGELQESLRIVDSKSLNKGDVVKFNVSKAVGSELDIEVEQDVNGSWLRDARLTGLEEETYNWSAEANASYRFRLEAFDAAPGGIGFEGGSFLVIPVLNIGLSKGETVVLSAVMLFLGYAIAKRRRGN